MFTAASPRWALRHASFDVLLRTDDDSMVRRRTLVNAHTFPCWQVGGRAEPSLRYGDAL